MADFEIASGIALESDNLRLIPFTRVFLTDRYISWLNDPDVCRYNSHGSTLYTRQKAEEYLTSIQNNPAQKVFAIIWKQSGEHIGNAGLYVSAANRAGELTILIGEKNYWGRGAGYEAFRLLRDYSFGDLDLHRLKFGFAAENRPIQRIAEKLGFSKEGHFKDALLKNGRYLDIEQWALLNPRHAR